MNKIKNLNEKVIITYAGIIRGVSIVSKRGAA
jgi:hypothetical protein